MRSTTKVVLCVDQRFSKIRSHILHTVMTYISVQIPVKLEVHCSDCTKSQGHIRDGHLHNMEITLL